MYILSASRRSFTNLSQARAATAKAVATVASRAAASGRDSQHLLLQAVRILNDLDGIGF
jgi:hypothetical protein